MYWANRISLKRRSRAFTFIEVMIVIVIIGLLAGAVTLSTRHFIDKARLNRAKTDISTLKSALAAFYSENGRYPSSDEGLAILAPKFVEKVHNDPWGRAYQYNNPGRNGPYEVISLGPDGREGADNISSDDLDSNINTEAAKASP